MASPSSAPATNEPARPSGRAPRPGRVMPPAQASDADNRTTATATRENSSLVGATRLHDVEETGETALIVDQEVAHLAEQRLVVAGVEPPALPRMGVVDLRQDVGQVRGGIAAVGVLPIEVAQDGQQRLLGVDVVR